MAIIRKIVERSVSLRKGTAARRAGGPIDYPIRTALDAFLKLEWPDLSWRAAYAEHQTELDCLTGSERRKYVKRWRMTRRAWEDLQIDRAIENRLRDMKTPEQAEAERREIIARLAPPHEPFRWDPKADPATNSYRKKIDELNYKPW